MCQLLLKENTHKLAHTCTLYLLEIRRQVQERERFFAALLRVQPAVEHDGAVAVLNKDAAPAHLLPSPQGNDPHLLASI